MTIVMKAASLAFLLLIALPGPTPGYSQRSQVTAQGAPPASPAFKVAGRDSTALTVLVPPPTTQVQLAALLNKFRTARMNGTLATLIPATTPRGSKGPYGIVMVFVLSDPTLATSQRLHAFINNPRTNGISASDQAFAKSIRAYYYYSALGPHEEGSIGHEEYTTTYKKLF